MAGLQYGKPAEKHATRGGWRHQATKGREPDTHPSDKEKGGTGCSLSRQMEFLCFLPWPSPAHGKALLETLAWIAM
jgi:hypothetical protein